MAELIVKLGDQVLQTYAFEGELLRVGRSRENDIVLENLSISRHHVQIRLHEGQYVILDMNSSNGTFLNGTRVTRRELMHGDQIAIGKYLLQWVDLTVQDTVVVNPRLEEAPGSFRARTEETKAEGWVKVESGRLQGREFRIVRFETTIGKAPSNDIVLTDDWLLAKKQAIILRRGNDEFLLEDLGGIRKVKVNGKAIDEPVVIKTGDKLEIGGTKLTFYSTAAKHPSAPAQIIVRHNDEEENPDVVAADREPVNAEAAHAAALENDSLDLEELFEPPSEPALPAAEEDKSPYHAALEGRDAVFSTRSASGFNHQPNGNGSHAGPAAAYENRSRPGLSAVKYEENPAVNDKEIQVWESALNNPSPAIRKQALKMLKKLTGRDYDV